MTKTIILTGLLASGIVGLTGCPGGLNSTPSNSDRIGNSNSTLTNTNSGSTANTNSMMNSNSSNMNSSVVNSNQASVVRDNFYTAAAQGGMAEIEAAKLALQKSQNAEVKKFAQMIVTDHTKANAELKTLAEKKNVTLPTDTGKHKSMLDDLSKLSGAEFDKEYVAGMVKDHEEDVKLFEDNSSNSDADVKAFAAKALPTLKSHLDMIKGIQNKMK